NALGPRCSFWSGDHHPDVHADIEFRNRLLREIAGLEEQVGADLRRILGAGKLVAYGRPQSLAEPVTRIPSDFWAALTSINWKESAVGENRPNGTIFYAVRVFPVILAPDRLELLSHRSLAEIFRDLVLQDPEVASYANEGMKNAPEWEAVFVRGKC